MIEQVIKIANQAAEAIMEIYKSVDPEVKYKKDDSPVTQADILSNELIIKELKQISDLPILTEETQVLYEQRKTWNKFWLVDPLDGTKDFLVKNDQFTVNIALVENRKPILGAVLIPAEGLCYWAEKDKGAFKNGEKIYNNSKRTDLIGSDSNFHSTEETQAFYAKHNVQHIQRYGSALKFCKLAEGEIDLYARLNGTMEWDTAAGHIIMNEAGCKIIDVKTKSELIYNKETLLNNHFIACRNDLSF
ncbi:MAG: 3'(2'),5'-bisphosphate nucleotidase [Candidatus Melainabacteria bacterium GWF2_37_15]|nr:MAG: 3'(2'),5'-bisphosphate nucleotidase [Candidatus Melainabacteria bacterium GWF2_37_15]